MKEWFGVIFVPKITAKICLEEIVMSLLFTNVEMTYAKVDCRRGGNEAVLDTLPRIKNRNFYWNFFFSFSAQNTTCVF